MKVASFRCLTMNKGWQNVSSLSLRQYSAQYSVVGWEYGPLPIGPKEIDVLLVLPGKACRLLTDHLITG